MKSKTKILAVFILAHLIIITSIVVVLFYDAYPREATGWMLRFYTMKHMHEELLNFKEQNGEFPQSIDSLWIIDREKQIVFFGSQESHAFFQKDFETSRFQYEIIDSEPVLIDLGLDNKQGGLGMNWDVAYPAKFQKPFPFRDFTKTKYFRMALFQGLTLAFLASLCLYGIGTKLLPPENIKFSRVIALLGVSIVYLFFAHTLTHIILYAHIFPHH